MRRLPFSLFVAAALLALPVASPAAAPVKTAWAKVCEKSGCSVQQIVLSAKSKTPMLRVWVTPDSQADQISLHLAAPIGVLLPNGITISVDGSKPITLPYQRCIEEECRAQAVVNFDALTRLLQGRVLTVRYAAPPGQNIDVLVMLDGLDPALQALPKQP